MASGNYNEVPMIIGYNDREGYISELNHLRKYGSIQVDKLQDFVCHIPWYYNIEKKSDMEKNVADKIKKFYLGNDNVTNENIDEYFKVISSWKPTKYVILY